MQSVPTPLSPDVAVPSGTMGTRPVSRFERVCGTCGVKVASGEVQQHIDWHKALSAVLVAINAGLTAPLTLANVPPASAVNGATITAAVTASGLHAAQM